MYIFVYTLKFEVFILLQIVLLAFSHSIIIEHRFEDLVSLLVKQKI